MPSDAKKPAVLTPAALPTAKPSPRKRVQAATAPLNARVLTDLRRIITNQMALFAAESTAGRFTASEMSALHRLAETYRLMSGETDREHEKYDLTDVPQEELDRLEAESQAILAAARALLKE